MSSCSSVCVMYVWYIHMCMSASNICLKVLRNCSFPWLQSKLLAQHLLRKSCPKNISSGPKWKTCSMEQFRERNVCDLEEFISILLIGIACMSCLVFWWKFFGQDSFRNVTLWLVNKLNTNHPSPSPHIKLTHFCYCRGKRDFFEV